MWIELFFWLLAISSEAWTPWISDMIIKFKTQESFSHKLKDKIELFGILDFNLKIKLVSSWCLSFSNWELSPLFRHRELDRTFGFQNRLLQSKRCVMSDKSVSATNISHSTWNKRANVFNCQTSISTISWRKKPCVNTQKKTTGTPQATNIFLTRKLRKIWYWNHFLPSGIQTCDINEGCERNQDQWIPLLWKLLIWYEHFAI